MTKVKVVKSPFVTGGRKLSTMRNIEPMIISVTLPNGMIITSPEQFQEEDEYTAD